MDNVLAALNANQTAALETLKDLLRIPSVSAISAHKLDVRKAAEFVRDQLSSAGLTTEFVETAGHPIVYAEWLHAAGAPTVLVYGHYDVQPPDPLDKWVTPAFEPTVRDGCIWARGATDDKGQMLTHVLSVAAWLKTTGRLPINVKFVIEGEEVSAAITSTRFWTLAANNFAATWPSSATRANTHQAFPQSLTVCEAFWRARFASTDRSKICTAASSAVRSRTRRMRSLG